ncbi:MAG: hypothetical protein RI556_12980 [Hydrogenovibrio sp.]|uniref:hypothetical protein n=1 Tax=Hydrogenovibrio sp. TaxID=2065821 RepID=UPI0028700E35|nr:hypothetical protein [Hydrogenovibrio sp.]MDR9500084.1 hypothetical protein [Hydrogenovibrio sp.]
MPNRTLIKTFKAWVNSKPHSKCDLVEISAEKIDNQVKIFFGEEEISISFENCSVPDPLLDDYALWVCLPIAMAKGCDVHVKGVGSTESIKNAERLSDIWSAWLPSKYSLINVNFSEINDNVAFGHQRRPLMCYSGGADSTYSLINFPQNGTKPDLLTVKGMDYRLNSGDESFQLAIKKNKHLVDSYSNERFVVSTDAYDIFRKHKIKASQAFIFLLASVASLFSRTHSNWILAADHAWYQQFEAFPYGSTFATNRHFSNGLFSLETHGEDVTRAEKLKSISENKAALNAISFCKDKSIRPENCGVCVKCLRTKYMFLASVGQIPNSAFLNPVHPSKLKIKFSSNTGFNNSYVKDTYKTAFRNGYLHLMPEIIKEYRKIS